MYKSLFQLEQIYLSASTHMIFLCSIIAVTFGINIFNWFIAGSRLNILGLYPRNFFGLIGVLCSPILHGNFNHLFFNSIPFFVLSLILLGFSKSLYIFATLFINVSECLVVWLFGRKKIHIGASGLVSGYLGFVLGLAYVEPGLITFVIAFFMIYYFGAILLGLFPTNDRTSWESHLAGFLSGIGLVYLFKYSNWFQKYFYEFSLMLD
jgi:membrane associated rhomboid family serine protease